MKENLLTRAYCKCCRFSVLISGAFVVLSTASIDASSAQVPSANRDSDATAIYLTEKVEHILPRDLLTAELRVEVVGTDPKNLQATLNQRMRDVLSRADHTQGLELETTGYSVYQASTAQPVRWQASQDVRITGRDFGAMLDIVGTLQQQGILLSDLSASISSQALAAVQGELTSQAFSALKARVSAIASAWGTHPLRYAELHIGNATVQSIVRPLPASANIGSTPVPPAVEAGNETVSLTINAVVLLAPASR